jgi:AraC-like DNA-binding protein
MAFRGRSSANTSHAHSALQVCVGLRDDVVMADARRSVVQAAGLLVPPGVTHTLQPHHALMLVFFEPQTPWAVQLLAGRPMDAISVLPEQVCHALRRGSSLARCIDVFVTPVRAPSTVLDSRLLQALDLLMGATGQLSLAMVASQCGLSPSRLRALAKQQLQSSLTDWLTWRRLENAGRELMRGSPLSEIALVGGFSDQAHFSRTMRRVVGLSPKIVQKIVCSASMP